ncbi:MAG: hypothetical protein A3E37_03815 [Candidatus Andersenbacteria bacterium RIFCSPHIGHO2_12_FULL_46_9]|nr:MAG: hypothetical protein UW94_C0012G0007 [Parcubacteria group bacterium GW2011_GWA2_45_14]OGY34417.1 MAG: hypothetical protein A3B76_03830 [Candidatus Andersenbacteria bacterium RIFCSPHIGHO2_02_FULL_46_16]OGY35978.1 MAG: hypothetical protein A3E37_03815 [Candidatus Andersenbacteria bacterium RIFCSPHIGHO2_12_FULL_46_9]OGY39963.1 MAG: hypothetical protein A3G57_00320 [Candidatus Andersenbacteria bacterium RIFCSPLOWO2_12_FULL_45_8]HBE89734.1 hypothetical protein [Candidatus Andersenbacteria ba
MPSITRSLLFVAAVTVLALSVFPVIAQVQPIVASNCGFLNMTCFGTETFTNLLYGPYPFILALINTALSLVGITAAAFIVYAGFLYISSTGDEDNSSRAKRQIIYALLGIFVAGTASLIVDVVISKEAAALIVSIRAVANAIISLLAVGATVYIIIAGVMYFSSTGDEDQASRAKMQIIYAIIGLVVIALSGVAVNLIILAL